MGYAIAYEAALRGADVTLVTGPTNLKIPFGIKEAIEIKSSRDMYEAVYSNFKDADILIKSAAVADYRPKNIYSSKIKKKDDDLKLELERTDDILKSMGELKENQIIVGFAAETDDLIENAKGKIEKKNLDFIVANDVKQEGAGFANETNIVKIISRDSSIESLPIISKKELSKVICDKIIDIIHKR